MITYISLRRQYIINWPRDHSVVFVMYFHIVSNIEQGNAGFYAVIAK